MDLTVSLKRRLMHCIRLLRKNMHVSNAQKCVLWFLRPWAEKHISFLFSRLHSHTFRIWYPYWSLIAMATSDFPCSLGPVLSLPNQNETFVKIPSGSTYSTHYDELTLHRGENDSERERHLQAICLWAQLKNERKRQAFKWHYNIHSDLKTIDKRQPSPCQQAFLSIFLLPNAFFLWMEEQRMCRKVGR